MRRLGWISKIIMHRSSSLELQHAPNDKTESDEFQSVERILFVSDSMPHDAMNKDGEYRVTLSIFSGVPDPVWTINSSDKSFNETKEHLKSARARGETYRPEQIASKLGYRGFLVQDSETGQKDLIVGHETAALQKILLDSMPHGLISDTLKQKVLQSINSEAV